MTMIIPRTVLILLLACIPVAASTWETLKPGLELRWITATVPSDVGDSRIAVLRIDPARWELDVVMRSQTGDSRNRTARQWAREHGLTAAINAGMFATDHLTHVGYLESRGHVNAAGVNAYQSVAAFHPDAPDTCAPFRIFDLDAAGVSIAAVGENYASPVQNLRLIKRPGENRWSEQPERWSEAALGKDRDGNILMIFSRSPFSMHGLNGELLAAEIDLVALQHLEGGPEAQLFVDAGGRTLECVGSYETSFNENDDNIHAWPIPSVLGVRPRMPGGEREETR